MIELSVQPLLIEMHTFPLHTYKCIRYFVCLKHAYAMYLTWGRLPWKKTEHWICITSPYVVMGTDEKKNHIHVDGNLLEVTAKLGIVRRLTSVGSILYSMSRSLKMFIISSTR